MRSATRAFLIVAAAAALALAANASALARSAYDGVWSVLIITESGNCPQTYRTSVQIVNGTVYATDASVAVSGRVSKGGGVSVAVSSGGNRAHGSGRLSARYGGGRWSSPAGCSGRWQAQRSG